MKPYRFERGQTRRWRSIDDVAWHVGCKDSGYRVVIPAGTEFESSVPWWARIVWSPDDPKFLLAALVHDHLLEVEIYGPPQAAAEWFDAALAGGASRWRAGLGFVALAAHAAFVK